MLIVMALPANVRMLRPIRILLASDDAPFVERLVEAAAARSISIDFTQAAEDIDVALARYGSNVYVLDTEDALPRGARSATAFAALHPDIPVVLIADRAGSRTVAGLLLLEKWRSTDRLLGEIELAFLGLRP